jgi:apolipoprotein D and lipocalin family protein
MLRGFISVGLFCVIFNTAAAPDVKAAQDSLNAIPALDVARYMGRWHEIAKFPNRFQKMCASDTEALYSQQEDGRLQVINRCRQANGELSEVIGAARQVGDANSPKLKVRFAPAWLSFIPMVWGNYWVVDIDDNYQLAAISEPSREYLWILARKPEVDPATYAALVERLKMKGLDVGKLERSLTKQP